MINEIISVLTGIAITIGGLFGINEQPKLGAFSDPFLSIQLAQSPTNGYCLRTDGTNNEWSATCGSGSGGGSGGTWSTTTSQVANQLINYSNNTTDIVTIGATATTTAKFWFDPNLTRAFFGAGTPNANFTQTITVNGGINLEESTGLSQINMINRANGNGVQIDLDSLCLDFNGQGGGLSDLLVVCRGGAVAIATSTGHALANFTVADRSSQRIFGAGLLNGGTFLQDINGGGWGMGYDFLGSGSTNVGGFGGTGSGDSLTRLYMRTVTAGEALSVLNSNGNVGIATTSPYEKLSVTGNIVATGNVEADVQFIGNTNDTVSAPSYTWMNDTNTGIFRPAADTIGLTVGGSEWFRMLSNGAALFGTTTQKNSSERMVVHGAGDTALVVTTSGTAHAAGLTIGQMGGSNTPVSPWMIGMLSTGTNSEKRLIFSGASNVNITSANMQNFAKMVLDATTGNLGIGTSSPSSRLSVSGNASIGANYAVAAPTDGLIVEGSVGIGLNSPASTRKLTVRGDGTTSATFPFEVQNSAGTSLLGIRGDGYVFVNSSSGIQMAAGAPIASQSSGAAIAFQTGGASTGNIDITTNGGASKDITLNPAAGGQVGVNNSTPIYDLDVTGDSRFTGIVDAQNFVATSTTATSTLPNLDVSGLLAATMYRSFTYATSTAWTGTTTIPLGPAYTAENFAGIKCFSDTGTVNLSLYDGTNRMNMVSVSTTVGETVLSTNNTFTPNEKRYVDIGTPASSPTKVSCTIAVKQNQ